MSDGPLPNPWFDITQYSPEELSAILQAAGSFILHYQAGVAKGGSVSWEDLDGVYQYLVEKVPRLKEAMPPF